MFMLAFAQATTGSSSDLFSSLLIPLLGVLAITYFLILRPQAQQAKAHREMMDKVRRGDTVVTSGGFVGKVLKVSDTSEEIDVELADNLRVKVMRNTLLDVRSKNEPVKDAKDKA